MGSTNRTSAFVQRHRYWALTLLGLIVAWSLAYTIIGAVCGAAAIIYIDNNGDGAPYNTWSPGLLTAGTIFFWITIPLFWFFCSTFALVRTWQGRLQRSWLFWIALPGILLLLIQFALEFICVYVVSSALYEGSWSFCPAGYQGTLRMPYEVYVIPLDTYAPFLLAAQLILYLGLIVFGIIAVVHDRRQVKRENSIVEGNMVERGDPYAYAEYRTSTPAPVDGMRSNRSPSPPPEYVRLSRTSRYSALTLDSIDSLQKEDHSDGAKSPKKQSSMRSA